MFGYAKKDKICYLNLTWGNGYHKRFVSRPSVETPHCDISWRLPTNVWISNTIMNYELNIAAVAYYKMRNHEILPNRWISPTIMIMNWISQPWSIVKCEIMKYYPTDGFPHNYELWIMHYEFVLHPCFNGRWSARGKSITRRLADL